jgi:hypothetical protein
MELLHQRQAADRRAMEKVGVQLRMASLPLPPPLRISLSPSLPLSPAESHNASRC